MSAVLLIVKIILGAWLIVAALFLIFMRSRRTESHRFQATTNTWRWRTKLAIIWPYWVFGLAYSGLKESWIRRKTKFPWCRSSDRA